jgi:hypothetical protein
MPGEERKPIAFSRFGGLRLDQAIDEVGPENSIYERDVERDGSTGRIRPRDGFQKLKATDASGPYKGLFPHSSARLLATKRVSAESLKLVAIDREGVEKTETTLNKAAACSTFARFGTPSASYTYMRTNTVEQKVVRFDGSAFTEPTATLNKNPDGSGGTAGKEMPKAALMIAWPAGDNRLVAANTGAAGGPGGAASSNSHVWFSDPGNAEAWHTDPSTQAGEANYVQLSPGDGEEITALAAYRGQLFVFKETKFFVFYGVSEDGEGRPEFDFREESLGEGTRVRRPNIEALAESSDQMATAASTGVFFCASDGIWVTTGGEPTKVSQALRPLEEISPFDGPMAELLNGSTEVFRWPAAGIVSLGQRLIVKRYEFLFVLDLPSGEWTCWKMPQVSLAVWTGLSGGGSEAQGAKTPGTIADDASVGVRPWEDLENAKTESPLVAGNQSEKAAVSAHVFSVAPEPQVSHYLKVTNFGFSIPEGATVRGWQSMLRRCREPGSEVKDSRLRPVKGGVIKASEDKANTSALWTTEFQPVVYGGPEDLWGNTWTPADINSSGFGIALSVLLQVAGTKVAFVDVVKITVFYSVPEAVSGVRPRLFCTQSKSVFFAQPGASEDAGTRRAEWQSGFYDLGAQDEKTLVESKVWGEGDVAFAGFRDLDPIVDFEDELDFGEVGRGQARGRSTQTATLFSHRLRLQPGSAVQRVVRYLRETLVAGGEGT